MTYIPGIFNYCDRWCERCSLSSRCENYTPYFKGSKDELIKRDALNKVFWEHIDNQINKAVNFVEKKADERNIDISDIKIEKKGVKFDLFQGKAQTNDVLLAGRKYEDLVDDWFDDAAEKYSLQGESLETSELKLPKDAPFENIENINSMIEIIFRYQLQIYLKLSRAFFSKGKEVTGEQEGDDSTGAARLVIELMERSLAAWHFLYENFSKEHESILKVMFSLESLRNRIIKEFPNVIYFKRKGFDELEL
jgi:hypothetical protein